MVDSGSFFHLNNGPASGNTRVIHSFALHNLANGANPGLLKQLLATYPSATFFPTPHPNQATNTSQLPFLSPARPQIPGQFCYQQPGTFSNNLSAPHGPPLVSIDMSPPLTHLNPHGAFLNRGAPPSNPLCINSISGRQEPFSFYQSQQQMVNAPYQPSASLSSSNSILRSNASVKESFDSSMIGKPTDKGRQNSVPSSQDKKKSGFSKTNLYIAGLSENVTDDMVFNLVEGIVIPKSCKALLCEGKCTGTGFIDCKTEEDAAKAKNHIEKMFKGFNTWCLSAGNDVENTTNVVKIQSNNNQDDTDEQEDENPSMEHTDSSDPDGVYSNGVNEQSGGDKESNHHNANGFMKTYLNLRLMTREGKNLEVKFAYENEKDLYNIYVKNLPRENFTEEQLQNIFLKYGTVTSVKLLEGKNGSGPTGSGFVRFANTDDARRAIENINELHIILQGSGQAVRCKLADKTDRHISRITTKNIHSPQVGINCPSNLSNKSSYNPIISGPMNYQVANPVINTAVVLRPTVPLVNNPASLPVAGGYTFHYAGPPQQAMLSSLINPFNCSINTHGNQSQSFNNPFLANLNGATNPVSAPSLAIPQGLSVQPLRSVGQPSNGQIHSGQASHGSVNPAYCDPNVMAALQAHFQTMQLGGHIPSSSTNNTGLFNPAILHTAPALLAQPLLMAGNDLSAINYNNMMTAGTLIPVGLSSQPSAMPTASTNSSQQLPQPNGSSQNTSTRN